MVERLLRWVSYVQSDPKESEAQLREEQPLLLQATERVSIALTSSYESAFFTSKRMLQRSVNGVAGRKIKWRSVPYSSMQAFSMELAGHWQTNDVVLRIWTKGGDLVALTCQRGNVNAYAVHSLLSQAIVHLDQWMHAQRSQVFDPPTQQSASRPRRHTLSGKAQWLGFLDDDTSALNPREVERHLMSDPRVLEYDEQVELVMKSGKNLTLLTSKRIILGNIRGWAGKKIEFVSLPWRSVRLYEVEAHAGGGAGNMVLRVWTDITELPVIVLDLVPETNIVDLMECFSAKVLGVSVEDFFNDSPHGEKNRWVGVDRSSWQSWLSRRMPTRTATLTNNDGEGSRTSCNEEQSSYWNEIDKRYHAEPRLLPVLQKTEHVELALVGHTTISLLTTKRFIYIKSIPRRSEQVTFLSIPWSSIQSFAVRSDGESHSELSLWTDVMYDPKTFSTRSAQPGKSFLRVPITTEQVQEVTLHKYLSARCLAAPSTAAAAAKEVAEEAEAEGAYDGLQRMAHSVSHLVHMRANKTMDRRSTGQAGFSAADLLGGSAQRRRSAEDAQRAPVLLERSEPLEEEEEEEAEEADDVIALESLELELDTHITGLLRSTEKIVLGFVTNAESRDITCFTTERALVIDRHESGPYEIINLPWKTLRGFTVLVSNVVGQQAKVVVHMSTPWMPDFQFDLKGGSADMLGIQRFLSAQLLGASGEDPAEELSELPQPKASKETLESINTVVLWFMEDWHNITPAEVESSLRVDPPILLASETVSIALKVGPEMLIVTSRRLLQVKINGWKKEQMVEFRSIPLSGCTAHSVQSAGTLSWDAETAFETDVPSMPRITQDLYKSKEEVNLLHGLVASSILM